MGLLDAQPRVSAPGHLADGRPGHPGDADDAARDRFVGNVAGHILGGVNEETLPRVFDYWKSVDSEIGKRIEEAVRGGLANPVAPHEAQADGVVDSPARR